MKEKKKKKNKGKKKVNKRNNIELGTLQFKVFEMCLLMSNSQGLFETFLLYEKLSADIIGFNTSIPLNVMKYILIVVKNTSVTYKDLML